MTMGELAYQDDILQPKLEVEDDTALLAVILQTATVQENDKTTFAMIKPNFHSALVMEAGV